jgi:hypothetical protein
MDFHESNLRSFTKFGDIFQFLLKLDNSSGHNMNIYMCNSQNIGAKNVSNKTYRER